METQGAERISARASAKGAGETGKYYSAAAQAGECEFMALWDILRSITALGGCPPIYIWLVALCMRRRLFHMALLSLLH
jgi:hypothetical protein